MKNFNKIAAYVLAALVVTACNNDEDIVNNGDGAVRFSAQISKQTDGTNKKARASGVEWGVGDAIGTYAFENRTTTLALNMQNKKYTVADTGEDVSFTPEGGVDIYFPVNGTEKFDFMAYYPYQDVTDFVYNVDVSNQTKPSDIDLLYAKTADIQPAGYDKYNPDVKLVFYHKLAKLTLETVAGQGLTQTDLTDMTVTIKGMNTKAEFNLETAVLANPTASAGLTPVTVDKGKKYESILLPATSANDGDWVVEFVVNNNTYVWTIPAMTFVAGTEHIWEISVQKVPVLISGRIVRWEVINKEGIAW